MKMMLSIARSVAFVLLLAAAAGAQSGRVAPTAAPTPDDTERVLTEEIKLNVLAFDENGKFFNDVSANDLVITENNVLHQPASVRRIPANVLIMMDTGGEMRTVKSLELTRRVAASVVDALRPGDSVAIMEYSNKPDIVAEWTTDKGQAHAAINHTKFGLKSTFVDAVKMATDFMLKDPIENRHLVLITDGVDSMGRSSAKFDAFQRLKMTDISVHVISYDAMESADIEPRTKAVTNAPPPRPALPPEVANQLPNGARDAQQAAKIGPTINMDRRQLKTLRALQAEIEASQAQLDDLADKTNGEFILPDGPDEMVDKAALVAHMIDASYVVTYTPKVPVVGTRGIAERNIQVTSKRPGLVVQARRQLLVNAKK